MSIAMIFSPLQMHQVLDVLTVGGGEPVRDSDSTSGCSADMSNSDSGRGASEEGDPQQNTHAGPHKRGQSDSKPATRLPPNPDRPCLVHNRPTQPKMGDDHHKGVKYMTCPLRCGSNHLPGRVPPVPTPPCNSKYHNGKPRHLPPTPGEGYHTMGSQKHSTGCHGNQPSPHANNVPLVDLTVPRSPSNNNGEDLYLHRQPLMMSTFGYNNNATSSNPALDNELRYNSLPRTMQAIDNSNTLGLNNAPSA